MFKKSILFIGLSIFSLLAIAQKFEEPKLDGSEFDGLKVNVGADFAMQFQALNHSADSLLIPLGKGINLPTANFIIDAGLAPGIKVHLTTYLSSRHHTEAWVKGGYLIVDQLPFIPSEGLDNLMNYLTFRVGVMELNYGDAHFRRSDNGHVINNPFVGNYIMDAFTTAPALEVMYRNNGILAMGGITTGTLKPALVGYNSFSGYTEYNVADELAYYGKVGIDKQINDDFRLRATLSGYHSSNNHFGSLYNGDRTGSRYYLVMKPVTNSAADVDPSSGHTTGRWGPGFTDEQNSVMLNLFTKYKGLEFFGTYEKTSGTGAFGGDFDFSQVAGEALYRFGKDEQFFGGLRYNKVSNDADLSVDRFQVGAGWFLTENIVLKGEYVDQNYNEFISQYGENAGFNGVMVEAAISF
jgi:hypothetical protein